MKVKLDENLPFEILTDLRQAGHDAESVRDEGLSGQPDPVILAKTREEARVLFTLDKGIGNIRAYNPERYSGIVLFRPPTEGRRITLEFVRRHLARILELELASRLVVVSGIGIRVR